MSKKKLTTWATPGGEFYTQYADMLNQSHLFIGGANGSGKSVIINALIYTALRKLPGEVAFFLCDPKMVELSRYANLPHVLSYADTLEDIAIALQVATSVMMSRFSDMKKRGVVEYEGGDIYVIIDEASDLLTKGSDRGENALRKSCETSIERIAKLGRAAHVHLILATQSPNRQTIKANIMNNMTARVALRCMFPIESRQIIGIPDAINLPDPKVDHRAECYYLRGLQLDHYNFPMIDNAAIDARIKWWTDQTPPKRRGLLRRLFGNT